MRSTKRWNEICSKCGQACKNTGAWWIDDTRVCKRCRVVLSEDIEMIRELHRKTYGGRVENKMIVEVLKKKRYKIYPALKRRTLV